MVNKVSIIQPDDWHVHFREGDMLKAISVFSAKYNKRCIAMPNLKKPITFSSQAINYKKEIKKNIKNKDFEVLIPCYLTENLDLKDFQMALVNNIFVGAKFYPVNSTTNSQYGISKLENIFPALEILEKENKILLVHGEKVDQNIDIFDREKYFLDQDLKKIREKFQELKIVLEHVSSSYGVDFINTNQNIAGTITPHHMLLTKKDVFNNNGFNPFNFCMPVVKDEKDLISLRKAACNNNKFFVGTDSAPHHVDQKKNNIASKAGIFSAVCSIELYTMIFEEEDAISNLESFMSINGPNFYNLPLNKSIITLEKNNWIVPEFTRYNSIEVKNFYGNKKINWKVTNLKV